MRRVVMIVGVMLVVGVSVTGQAPVTPKAPTAEEILQTRADLLKQATIGDLLKRAASCEANMYDLPTLKARVAELEALEKAQDPAKKPSQDAPIKPAR